MPRKRRVFGPLFYSTLVVAAVCLSGLGVRSVQPTWTIWCLSRQLGNTDPKVQAQAAAQLVEIGSDALPWVIRASKDRDARVRRHACSILGTIGPGSDAALSALIAALDDEDPEVQCTAAWILSAVGTDVVAVGEPTLDRAIQCLRAALDDQSPATRSFAATVLRTFGPNAGPAWAAFERAGHDRDPSVQIAATSALAQVGPRNPRLISTLRGRLRDRSPGTRSAAAGTLATLGPGAKSATADLELTTGDADPRVRMAAALALACVSPRNPGAIATLRALLSDPVLGAEKFDSRNTVKQGVAGALKLLAGEAILCDTFVALLAHAEASVRGDALWWIQGFVPLSKPVVSAVRNSLGDRALRVRGDAARFLINDAAQEPDDEIAAALVASVTCAAEDEEDLYRLLRAFGALRRVTPGSESQVVPTLLASLDRVSGQTRCDVVELLGQLGSIAAPAVAKLVELVNGQDPQLSAAAISALARIDPGAAEEAAR